MYRLALRKLEGRRNSFDCKATIVHNPVSRCGLPKGVQMLGKGWDDEEMRIDDDPTEDLDPDDFFNIMLPSGEILSKGTISLDIPRRD